MNQYNKTMKITFGAMTIVFFTLLITIDRQTGGVFSGSLLFLFPIPFMIYSNKFGFKDSIAIILATSFMALIFGNFTTNFIAISEVIIGTIYGTMQYHKRNKLLTLVIIILFSIFLTIASVTFLASLLNTNMMNEIYEVQTILKGYGSFVPTTLYSIEFLKKIYILSGILVGIMQGLIIFLIGEFVNKKTKKLLK